MLTVALPGVARAETQVVAAPRGTYVAGDPSLVAPSPGARGERRLRAAVFFEYARAPLALVAADQSRRLVVSEQLWVHAAASFAFAHRWLAALELPLLLRQRGDAAPFAGSLAPVEGGFALGDPQLMLRGRVLGEADGWALGVGLRASLPLATGAYAGADGPALGAFAALGREGSRSFSSFALGGSWQKSQSLPGILPTRVGSELWLAAAFGTTLDHAGTLRVGPELTVHSTVGGGTRLLDPRGSACSVLLHVQKRIAGGPFALGIAGGPTLGRAPGAADYRALLSFTYSPEEPMPPPDSDGDRIANEVDMCPSLVGEASEDPLMHGCPPIPSDYDGDGIPDTLDACPRTVGEPHVRKAQHGCPRPPPQPEPLPPPPVVQVEETQLSISQQVQFETGTAQLRDESSPLLRQVAEVLQQHPEIELCEVAGHTDNTGTAALNQELSQARAQAVLDWLVRHGISAERLTAKGYGATKPLADEATEAGRALNRRVELVIVRRRGTP